MMCVQREKKSPTKDGQTTKGLKRKKQDEKEKQLKSWSRNLRQNSAIHSIICSDANVCKCMQLYAFDTAKGDYDSDFESDYNFNYKDE